MISMNSKKELLVVGLFSLFLQGPCLQAGSHHDDDYLIAPSTLKWIGGAAAVTLGSLFLYSMYKDAEYHNTLSAEPIDNIRRYLKEVDVTLSRIEADDYMKTWSGGPESQYAFTVSIESCKRSGQALAVLTDLGHLSSQLLNHVFKEYVYRAEFLSRKYQAYQDHCIAMQGRIRSIEHAIKEMKQVVQTVYDRLDKQEALQRFYDEIAASIKKIQNEEVFMIDINTIKTLAYSKYSTSPWPYIDMIALLDGYKNKTYALCNSIQGAGAHHQQEHYLEIVKELYKRVVWAIDFITKDPEYRNQYNRKVQYDTEVKVQGNQMFFVH